MSSSDQERQERLQIMLSAEELTALDNWRFTFRMPSRAAAVRELLRLGLEAQGVSLARQGEKSSSFGLLGNASPSEEQQRGNPLGEGASRSSDKSETRN